MNEIFSGVVFLSSIGMAIALTGNQIDLPNHNAALPPLFGTAATQPLFSPPALQPRQPATQPATPLAMPLESLPFRPASQAVAAATQPATQSDAIQVDLSDRQLCYRGRCYQAWIGGPETPTPTGEFQILKIGDHLLDGRGNKINDAPVMVLQWLPSGWAVAIHGGGSVFGPYTQSCVRLSDADARKLANQVSVGTKVVIQE